MKNIIEFDHPTPDYQNLLNEYENHLVYANSAKSTIDTYLQIINQFVDFLEVPINKLDYIHIIHYKSELHDKQKQKATTINKKLQALKNFIAYLYNKSYIKN